MQNHTLTRIIAAFAKETRAYLYEYDREPGIPFALLIPRVRVMHGMCLDIMQMYALTELHGGTEPLSEEEQKQISVLRDRAEQCTLGAVLDADAMAHACVRRIDDILSRPNPSFDEIRGVLGAWEDYQTLVTGA